jgi:hypothetical protein
MVNKESSIRFTWSPLGNVIGGWMNISLRPNRVEDLLAA